jgi:hypothetical protein
VPPRRASESIICWRRNASAKCRSTGRVLRRPRPRRRSATSPVRFTPASRCGSPAGNFRKAGPAAVTILFGYSGSPSGAIHGVCNVAKSLREHTPLASRPSCSSRSVQALAQWRSARPYLYYPETFAGGVTRRHRSILVFALTWRARLRQFCTLRRQTEAAAGKRRSARLRRRGSLR